MESGAQKKFVIVTVLTVLVALAGIAAFNILVDPIGAYPGLNLEMFENFRYTNNDRVPKAELARRGDWEVIILGSSRAKAGLPAEHPFLRTNHTCNLSVDAAFISELELIFNYAKQKNSLRKVLLCLDFYMFARGPRWILEFPESRFSPEFEPFIYHCKRLFSEKSVTESWGLVKQKMAGSQPNRQSRLGFFEAKMSVHETQRAVFDRTMRVLGKGYSVQKFDPARMESLRQIVKGCRDGRIELRIAIFPVHALDLELLYADEHWQEFESWKMALVELLAEEGVENQFPLWDFTGYSGPSAERVPLAGDTSTRMRYFYENSHCTPLLGWQVVDALSTNSGSSNFGVKLDSTNVASHLARILADRAEYVRTNPEEVAWAKKIMSEVSQKPKSHAPGAKSVDLAADGQ